MGELQVIASKCRPEHLIAQFERGETPILDRVELALSVIPDKRFKVYRGRREAEQSLENIRQVLSGLPTNETVTELAAVARTALAASTEMFVRRQVADLIGSFPGANLTDPETYISALIFDLVDAQVPDAVIYFACQKIRRASKFFPSIAEVLSACEGLQRRWQRAAEFPQRLETLRAKLEFTASEAKLNIAQVADRERQRDDCQASWADSRQEAGEKPSVSAGCVCAYPKLVREFAGDAQTLDLITSLDSDGQRLASVKLATKGREAALAEIRMHSEKAA